ncbi:MAG: DUF6776 family protein [Betaproteobacteria bacterium]
MALSVWWRRARQHFSIDAPRMAVRSHLPWPWRAVVGLALLAVVAGMWWWGFDFGQIFGGFNRRDLETRLATLETEAAGLRTEAAQLRGKSSQLESELAMTSGTQATLSKQALELQNENSQVKEELVFLQKLVADSNKQGGLSIQRLAAERERDDTWHYSVLVVRGGSPKAEFEGQLALQVAVAPAPGEGAAFRPTTIALPDEQPETAAALKLKFKYYQRVEGSFRVPPGAVVRSLTARAYETGQSAPRATRNLVMP